MDIKFLSEGDKIKLTDEAILVEDNQISLVRVSLLTASASLLNISLDLLKQQSILTEAEIRELVKPLAPKIEKELKREVLRHNLGVSSAMDLSYVGEDNG